MKFYQDSLWLIGPVDWGSCKTSNKGCKEPEIVTVPYICIDNIIDRYV